ncbi:MAG TPA: hypothetical protein EYN91_27540 [Candidatus Melainabacteria bacterium]|nr:hypothetical protein [Candidatus Melainabacteria bacterium]HIN67382.1 hypothetical protein [Candidatus Obscuribacterales bacterium]
MKRFQFISSTVLVALAVSGCNTSFDVKTDSESGLSYNSSTKNGTDAVDKSIWTGKDGKQKSISNEKKISNGKSMRISARNIDGVESKLEAHGDVVFLKGKASKLPADAKVTLFEKREGVSKEGELRAEGSQIKVWMKKGNSYVEGNADDQAWADKLLASFNWDDTPDPEKKKDLAKQKLDDPEFAKKLATLHYSKDVTEVLTEKAKSPTLSAKEQVALIDVVFEKVHYDKDQKAILLALIHRKDLAKDASAHLLDKLDKIHYKEDQKLIQRELFDRASAH